MAERINTEEFRKAMATCLEKINNKKTSKMLEDLKKENESLLSMMEEPLDDNLDAQKEMHKKVYHIQLLGQKLHLAEMPI